MGNYCDFCETWHSSIGCYHPSRAKYDVALDKIKRLQDENKNLKEELRFIQSHGFSPLTEEKR